MLYLVPTPIGNLKDITFRAIEVLQSVDLILAEDTRESKKLLNHYNIQTAIQSFHSYNEHHQLLKYVELIKDGKQIALISDAGTPGISDPGYLLAHACREQNIPVIALPGATAFVPALVASGLPTDRFFFYGFLPIKKGRKTALEYLAALPCTVILYESPHRILKCVDELILYFGEDRQASFAKEISKMFEKHIKGNLIEIKTQLSTEKIVGEWVIILSKAEKG